MFGVPSVPVFLERKRELADALQAVQEIASLAPDDEATKHKTGRLRKQLQSRSR